MATAAFLAPRAFPRLRAGGAGQVRVLLIGACIAVLVALPLVLLAH